MNWKEIKQKENKDKFRTSSVSVGRDSVVGIATRYVMDGPGIESRWGGARFSAPVQNGPGAHLASCTRGAGYPSWGYSGRAMALTTHPI
jgi:hypothetical protein